MPYRGASDFMWRPALNRTWQVRAIGALALLLAGWGMGFVSGRLSALVFPVEATTTDAPTAVPAPAASVSLPNTPPAIAQAPPPASNANDARAAPPASSQPPPPPSAAPHAHTESAAAAPMPAAPPPTVADGVARDRGDAASVPEAADPQSEAYRPAAGRIINPDGMKSGQTEPSAAELSETPAREARMAECERRYVSFRRSDGTYQPYGRSARETCPLLR